MTNTVTQEAINNTILSILNGANDAGKEVYGASKMGVIKAVDFAQEQAPLVVQEFLQWKFAEGLIRLVVSLIVIGVSIWVCRKALKWMSNEDNDDTKVVGAVAIVFAITICFTVTLKGALPNMEQIAKIKIAPRVYLIEWISGQIKK